MKFPVLFFVQWKFYLNILLLLKHYLMVINVDKIKSKVLLDKVNKVLDGVPLYSLRNYCVSV